ncbi:MAG TPA: efflux transporter outer membrane subunit [Candidatus Limnocylindria bacterium]|nr:efflux transporter outer membrane subunit [Candidatus Limnocylindria bacterium]
MRKHLLNGTFALALIVSGCSLAPTYQRPQLAVPGGWSLVAGVGIAPERSPTPFWQDLGSAELNRLIDNALAQNLDLEAALHRIDQARAQAKVAGAPLYPSVSAGGSASRTYQDPRNTESVRGGAGLSYEVDLWGRNRNAAKSADHQVNATEFDREALRLVVTSDATNFYAQILSLNDRIRIGEFNLKSAEEVLRIIEARFAQGSVSGLEVSQQRTAVNNFRTALTSLIEQRSTTANALAILLGLPPQDFSAPTAELASLQSPPVSLTPPAALLTARPDIQSAEAGLLAVNADIGVARAAFFPSLTLGLDTAISAGFGGPAAAATQIASSLIAPIFTGGRLTGNLENVNARQKELAVNYQKTVLTAFREVEDALALLKSANERAVLSRATVAESQIAYDIAKARFDVGAIDYLNLLETQRSLYQAQDNQITITQGQISAFVQVRKALGS